MKYKALITDVDGTLVPMRRDGLPSEKVIQAISKAQNLIHIGVATSRPVFMLEHIFSLLELSGPSIVCGGAQIYDTTHKKILSENILDKDTVRDIVQRLRKYTSNFIIGDGLSDNPQQGDYVPDHPLMVYAFAMEQEAAEKVVEEFTTPTISVIKVNSYEKGKIDVEISATASTKQHGILQVAEILGISTEEIIGIGDSFNDFPLLMACGLKVAMGNAVEDLKAIADYVAPTVADDGFADVLEKFVLNEK